jgi:hypothetical protein
VQREALRHQTSKRLLLHSTSAAAAAVAVGSSTAAAGAAADNDALQVGDYEDLAALAGRLAVQQGEIQALGGQLAAANRQRTELAKVSVGVDGARLQACTQTAYN